MSALSAPSDRDPSSPAPDRAFFVFTAVVSTVALAFIAWLLLIRRGGAGGVDLRFLPAVNAGLNATAAALLVGGWISVRRRQLRAHRYFMIGAFAAIWKIAQEKQVSLRTTAFVIACHRVLEARAERGLYP